MGVLIREACSRWCCGRENSPARASTRSALVLTSRGSAELLGADDAPDAPVGDLLRYLIEPDGAVIRARLIGDLARHHQGHMIDATIAYVTTDQECRLSLASCFEILEVIPYSVKGVEAAGKKSDLGELEIKKRGLDIDPAQLRTTVSLKGSATSDPDSDARGRSANCHPGDGVSRMPPSKAFSRREGNPVLTKNASAMGNVRPRPGMHRADHQRHIAQRQSHHAGPDTAHRVIASLGYCGRRMIPRMAGRAHPQPKTGAERARCRQPPRLRATRGHCADPPWVLWSSAGWAGITPWVSRDTSETETSEMVSGVSSIPPAAPDPSSWCNHQD